VLKSAASVSAVPEPTTSAPKKGKLPKKPRRTLDPKKALVLGVCPPPSGSTPGSKRKTPEPCASRVFPAPHYAGGVADYMRTVAGPSSPSPRKKRGLLSSLHALDVVSVGKADPALVVGATMRCIDVLHKLFACATSPVADTPVDPTPREALNGIERTLPHVIRTALSTLDGADIDRSHAAGLRWHGDTTEGDGDQAQRHPNDTISALDLVLGRIATSLLVPAIRAIVPCTLAKTEHVLSSSSKGGEYADAADLLGLVGAALGTLSGLVQIALYDRVALEAVRALVLLIAQSPPVQRIHRIARKDALHFLCDAALLSLCRAEPDAAPPGSAREMLGMALEAALGEIALMLSARVGKSGLDAVEEQCVLIVLERAWSVGRRVGSIGGDAGDDERTDASQGDVHGQGVDVDVTMTDVDGEDRE
jgi:hypothetical protein